MTLDELRRNRPRDPFLQVSAMAFVALIVGSWLFVDFDWPEPGRAWRNLLRFAEESRPTLTFAWWAQTVRFDVVANTVALAVVGTALATVGGALSVPGASRKLTEPTPWLPDDRPWARAFGGLLRGAVRLGLVFLRAIPEYVWAFLLVALWGLSPWPAVLALGLHNGGILGKLFTETVDDLEPAAPRALAALGAGRFAIATAGVLPQVQRRWLLYVFVRWESCIREATVVGLVGVVSIGWAIREARARTHYDEMVALMLVSALLIVGADALSLWLRSRGRSRWQR
ncbi:MAG: ABC transporter permease subunit [Myxococcota bacterium]